MLGRPRRRGGTDQQPGDAVPGRARPERPGRDRHHLGRTGGVPAVLPARGYPPCDRRQHGRHVQRVPLGGGLRAEPLRWLAGRGDVPGRSWEYAGQLSDRPVPDPGSVIRDGYGDSAPSHDTDGHGDGGTGSAPVPSQPRENMRGTSAISCPPRPRAARSEHSVLTRLYQILP